MTTDVETPETETPESTANVEADAPATPAAKKEPKQPTRCKCSLYSKSVEEDGEQVLVELVACTATTNGNFAPGHDAKLKSQLIQLGAADLPVYKTVDGNDIEMTAQDAANEYGFGPKVASGIERAKTVQADKDAAKAKREQAAKEREEKKAADKAAREAAAAAKKAEAARAKAAKKAEAEAKAATTDPQTAVEANADANGSDDESLF